MFNKPPSEMTVNEMAWQIYLAKMTKETFQNDEIAARESIKAAKAFKAEMQKEVNIQAKVQSHFNLGSRVLGLKGR